MVQKLSLFWNKLPWQVILAVFAIVFLCRSSLMPMTGDDYAYAFIWDPEHGGNLMDDIGPRQRLESIDDIFLSQWTHYFTWGGRTFSMLIIQFFAWQEKTGFAIANTIVYVLLMLVIYWLAMGKIISPAKAKGCFLWGLLGINFGVLDYITGMVWLTGACVYLWTGLWECAFLLPYALTYRCRDYWRQAPGWSVPIMFLGGIIAGWSQEGGSLVTLTIMGVVLVVCYRQEGRIRPWMLAGALGAVIGCLLLMLAPGSIMRVEFMLQYQPEYVLTANQLFTFDMFYRNFTGGFLPIILWESFLLLPLIIYFVKGNKSHEVKTYIMLFTAAGVGILCLMMFAPEFKVHTGFHSTMFLTVASGAALREIIPYLKEKFHGSSLWRNLYVGLGLLALVYGMISIVGALYIESSYAKQWQSRMEYVEKHRTDEEIEVTALYIPYNLDEWLGPRSLTRYHLIYGADLEYKPTDNRSNIFAQYYGLKSIRIDKEEDWEKVGGR